jgi:hypothetical protein
MAAWHHLNTDQTGIYVDPVEHVANLQHSTDARVEHYGDMDQMWESKEHAAALPAGHGHGSGILDSLMAGEPIRKPITMVYDLDAQPGDRSFRTSPKQIDGHHRVAAAAIAQAKLGRQIRVPVDYLHPSDYPFTSSEEWAQGSESDW